MNERPPAPNVTQPEEFSQENFDRNKSAAEIREKISSLTLLPDHLREKMIEFSYIAIGSHHDNLEVGKHLDVQGAIENIEVEILEVTDEYSRVSALLYLEEIKELHNSQYLNKNTESIATPPTKEELARVEKFESPEAQKVFSGLRSVAERLKNFRTDIGLAVEPTTNAIPPQSLSALKETLEGLIRDLNLIKESSDYEVFEYYSSPVTKDLQEVFKYIKDISTPE